MTPAGRIADLEETRRHDDPERVDNLERVFYSSLA